MMETMCTSGLCPFSQISWGWMAASVIISYALGMLWYGKLFGQQWLKAVRYQCPCGADLAKGETCTCKTSTYVCTYVLQLVSMFILALMYFVLTHISIWLSVLVLVAVCGWMKATSKFKTPETRRWVSLCTIEVGYFAVCSGIMMGMALI